MVRRGPLTVFIAVTFSVTWAAWLPLVLAAQWGVGDPPGWLHWVGSFGPLCGAVAATAVAEGARGVAAWARRVYSLRFPAVWWLAALAMPVAYWVLGYGAPGSRRGSGRTRPGSGSPRSCRGSGWWVWRRRGC